MSFLKRDPHYIPHRDSREWCCFQLTHSAAGNKQTLFLTPRRRKARTSGAGWGSLTQVADAHTRKMCVCRMTNNRNSNMGWQKHFSDSWAHIVYWTAQCLCVGEISENKPRTYLAQPATASCSLWLSDTCSGFSFSESSFCRGQIICDCCLPSLGPLSFRSIQYFTTVSFG